MQVRVCLFLGLYVISSTYSSQNTLQILKTKETTRNETVRDCIVNLFEIQRIPSESSSCCLMKFCLMKNNSVEKVQTLLDELCQEKHLLWEKQRGCKSFNSNLNFPTSTSYAPASNSQTRDKKIRFENNTKISARISGLQFLDVPKGDEMRIHNLRLEEGYLLFEVFSSLMGYLQPDEFPSELVRDALKKQVPFHLLAFQILKTEFGTLAWIIFWSIVALCIPFISLTYFCCARKNLHRLHEEASNISLDTRDRCVERTFTLLLMFFLTLEIIPIVLIFIGNEQISRQMTHSMRTTNLVFDDIDTFTRNTHMQISFVATSSTDVTIETIRKDLDNVEDLLGRPFQEELNRETGIDLVLNGLDEVESSSDEVTSLIIQLLEDCQSADKEANLLQEQLKEVARQLTIARQQCRSKDRPLCYTIQYTGLEVTFSCGNLTTDSRIRHLERMKKNQDLSRNIEKSRSDFRQLPQRVAEETSFHITEIKNVLSRRRGEVYKATHSLDELARSLSNSIRTTQQSTLRVVDTLNRWELWRWLSVLGVSTMVCLVWGLLLCAAPCGCGTTSRTTPLLISGVIVTSLICLPVWCLGIMSFLLGVHGQSLLCQPLYDHPHYKAVGEILGEGGVFKGMLKANHSLKIGDVLKNCQMDQPAYFTFQLHHLFNTNLITDYKNWPEFKNALYNITIKENLEILNPALQLDLQFLSTLTELDLTSHRIRMSSALTRKDLSAFAEQLNTVARQMSDPITSRKMDDLASKMRRIIRNELAQLSETKNRILYKITALDFLVDSLTQQANQTLTNLREMQFFLDHHGFEVAQRNSLELVKRLESHLEKLNKHVSSKVTKEIGRCRPLWDIFHFLRSTICKLIVDPTNGISLSSLTLTLLFLGIIIVVLNLVEHYRELYEELLTSITHRRARDGLIIDDEGTWATPTSEMPADAESRNNGQSEQGLWVSPSSRQSIEPLIPPAPRIPERQSARARSPKRLATIASRISAARVPQIHSISRARSPKRGRHESLRLIEPICWKSGSLSPKSWL